MGVIRCDALSKKGSGTALAAVVEPYEKGRLEAMEAYGVPGFATLAELLASGVAFEGVWICTRTDTHAPLILEAAAAGKHCAVEKPVAETIAATEQAYQACAAARVQLMCAFQRRADPAYLAAAAHVHAGALGEVASMHFVFRDHPTPPLDFLAAAGGCLFADLLVHDADYARFLTNDEVVSVAAHGASFAPLLKAKGLFDVATVVLVFAKGAVATVELSRFSAYGYDQRAEAFGANGCKVSVDNPPAAPWSAAGLQGARGQPAGTSAAPASGFAAAPGQLPHSFPERFGLAFEEEARRFGCVVRGEAAPAVCARDAVACVAIADAARQSAAAGGAPVPVAETGAAP